MGKHNTYAASHLGHMATELIKGISALQKKYPETDEANSVEKKHALKQLKTLETFIKTLNNNLLPQFDNRRDPGGWGMLSMVRDLYALYALKNEFNTRRYTLYLAIQKELPNIVKQAQRQFKEPQAIANAIAKALDEKTKSLFEKAALIPGDALEAILAATKRAITNINEHNIDLKEANCTAKLDAMLAQKLFKNKQEIKKDTPVKSASEAKIDALFAFEQGKTNLVIAHPMTFEFAELMVTLKENSPNELAKLIPFFNPEAFNVDFHSGAIGSIICELFGATYLLKNEPASESNTPSLVYQFTTYSKETKTETKVTIDGNTRYPILSEQYQKSLFLQVQQYITNYKATAYVQSLQARSKLLSGLTAKESEEITRTVKNHLDESQSQLNLSTLDSVAAIYAINNEIERNQLVLKNNLLVQHALHDQAKSYAKTTITHLLSVHPELAKQLQEYRLSGINTEFCEQPLPDLIIGTLDEQTNEVHVIQLQKQLQQLITEQLDLLQHNHHVLQEKIKQQQEQQQELISAWQEHTIHTYTKTTEKTLSTLVPFNDMLEQIKTENKGYVATNDTIETLEQVIANKKRVSLQLATLFQEVTTHLEETEQSAKLALELSLLDENHVVQNALTLASRPVIQKTLQLVQQIKLAQQEQTKEEQHLEMRLEKARSEALFAKNMQLTDPDKMKRLLLEVAQKQEELIQQQKHLNTELAEIPAKLDSKEQRLARLDKESFEKSAQIKIMNAKISPLIRSIRERAKKVNLLTTIPDEKELLDNYAQMTQFILNITQSMNNLLSDPAINYQEAHRLLRDVGECLKQGQNKTTIPFKTIDELPIIASMSKDSQFKGFNFFLSFVGLQEEISFFTSYRKSQEETLKINSFIKDLFNKKESKQEAYSQRLKQLETAINETQNNLLTHQDTHGCLREVISGFKYIFPILHQELNVLFEEKIKRVAEQQDIQTEHQECSAAIAKLKEEQTEKPQALERATKEQESLQIDQRIIASMTRVIESIQNLQQQIQLLANEEHAFYETALYHSISELQQQYSQLNNEVEKITDDAKQSAKEPTYAATLGVLTQLLESTQQQLTTTIKAKVDVSLLQKQHAQYGFDLAEIDNARTQETNSAKELLSHYNTLALLITQQDNLIKQLKTNASTINEEYINQSVAELELSQEQLQQQSNQLGESLVDEVIYTLSKLKTEAHVFDDTAAQESQDIQKIRTSTLEQVQQSFTLLPKTTEFEEAHLQFAHEKIATIKKLTQEVDEQLEQSQAANQELVQRIAARKTVVNELLLPKLDAYFEIRAQQPTLKKMLRSETERLAFITKIKDELADYVVSGDHAGVSVLIKANKKRFPGIHLQTILNKITVELFDLNQQVPQNYNQGPSVNIDIITRHQQAIEILQTQKLTQSNYVLAINKLFELIEDMANKWPQTHRLTDKLRQDIDRFVISHPNTVPDEKAYHQFVTLFTARLHSEDDELSRHRSGWKANLANLMIGVLTLGIALGIKLVHSRWNEGRYSLFFDKTRRQQQTALMEEIVEQGIAAPAA